MKVTFISNFFNHHQKPFSDMMYKLTDSSYRFISTEQMPEARKAMGYDKISVPEYVIDSSFDSESRSMAKSIIAESDVVIAGSVTEDYLSNYIQRGNLLFRYSERQFKSLSDRLKFPLRYIKLHKSNPKGKNIYLLAASAYSYPDYRSLGLFKNRAYKWGYFPETIEYNIEQLLNGKDRHKILWCGRFLDWKHPDLAIKVVRRLLNDGVSVEMEMIGTGPMLEQVQAEISRNKLDCCIKLLGAMPPDDVRLRMERAGTFLFTSDRNEGWGAVLNEAMNSGCAVVASDAAGATPYLIKDSVNGFTYKNEKELYEKLKKVICDNDLKDSLGRNAYLSIKNEWNATVAAERLFRLIREIQGGNEYPDLFESGPCSRA